MIPGTRKEKYLLDNSAAGSLQLSKEEVDEVRQVAESFEVAGARYHPNLMKAIGN